MTNFFEEDRSIEKKLFSYVNLFKLIIAAEATKNNYDQFVLVGGLHLLRSADLNILSSRDDETKATTYKTVTDIFNELLEIEREIKKITHGSSPSVEIALEEVDLIKNYYNKRFNFVKTEEFDSLPDQAMHILETSLPESLVDYIHTEEDREMPKTTSNIYTRKRK